MHVSRKSDSSSLLAIRKQYTDAFPGTEEDCLIEVDSGRLDDLVTDEFERPAMLKIDAQGGELGVLRGATRTLPNIDAVFVECSFVEFYEDQALADEIISELFGYGLRLRGIHSLISNADGESLQADLLFVRD